MARAKGAKGAARDGNPPRLSASAVHDVEFFKRRIADDPDQEVPAFVQFAKFPDAIRRRILAVLKAVAEAPPTKFAGGGMWEAMHDEMSGYFEVRVKNKGLLYRAFCLLDTLADPEVHPKPILAVIDAEVKKDGTSLPSSRYATVRALGDEYIRPISKGRHVRSLADDDDLVRYGLA